MCYLRNTHCLSDYIQQQPSLILSKLLKDKAYVHLVHPGSNRCPHHWTAWPQSPPPWAWEV